ncbi:MAG: Hsp20/alpha crystallin family protein [Candidatus Neomarinimicrobiota bacterium]
MTLVKYTPRRSCLLPFDDMDRLFNLVMPRPGFGDDDHNQWTPPFDIRETGDQLIFDTALPGLTKKDIEVTIHDGVLTVTGEAQDQEQSDGDRFHTTELRRGKFSRSFRLPSEVDEEQVDARYKNGILTITLNKVTPVEPEKQRITIK